MIRAITLAAALLLLSATVSAQPPPGLTNDDVVTLAKAGLPDDIIIAKIRQATDVRFSLEAADLISLREQGVSDGVVTAMLERTTSPQPVRGKVLPPGALPPGFPGVPPWLHPASLVAKEGTTQLTMIRGHYSHAGFLGHGASWMNFPGLHATTATTDRRPSLIIRSQRDPASSYEQYLVRLEVDEDDRVRSFKLRERSSFTSGGPSRPDEDWVIPFTTQAEPDGSWRLTPTVDLERGEYGLYTLMGLSEFSVK